MPYAWQCDRCKQVITPRGGRPPRYCPYCGQRLAGAPVEPVGGGRRRRVPGAAIAAVIFGLLSFVPVLGLVFAPAAVVLGARAGKQIRRLYAAFRGEPLAVTGIVLGALGLLFQIALCARLMR